jgi:hypothetical protein
MLSQYKELGLRLLPVAPGTKAPQVKWREFIDRPPTPDEEAGWWSNPATGVAAITGNASDLVVLDFDKKRASPEAAKTFAKFAVGTALSRTGSGGYHAIFRLDGGNVKCSVNIQPGLDVRGEGGIAVLPPTIHPNGRPYEWVRAPWNHPPMPIPPELFKLLTGVKEPTNGPVPSTPGTDGVIPEGQRNDALFRKACALRRTGFSEAEIEDALIKLNTRCVPPLPEEELHKIAVSAAKYDPSEVEEPAEKKEKKALFLTTPEPWSSSVGGCDTLDEITEIIRRFIVLPTEEVDAIALWVLHSWTADASDVSPRLHLKSATKRSGKSTLMSLLGVLVRRPLACSNISAPALYRSIESWRPTLLMDEADTLVGDQELNEALRGVLNAGHYKPQANIIRCVGKGTDQSVAAFNCYGPVALAGIGSIWNTLADRSIVIKMQRKGPGDVVEPLRLATLSSFSAFPRRAHRWATDNLQALRVARPQMPKGLNDRAADNWMSLLAIAELAGSTWPERARKAALKLSAFEEDEDMSPGELLLGDLAKLFADTSATTMSSTEICDALIDFEDRPWPEWKNSKPITPRGLAKLLGLFGIKPRELRNGLKKSRGYERAELETVWKKYVKQQDKP